MQPAQRRPSCSLHCVHSYDLRQQGESLCSVQMWPLIHTQVTKPPNGPHWETRREERKGEASIYLSCQPKPRRPDKWTKCKAFLFKGNSHLPKKMVFGWPQSISWVTSLVGPSLQYTNVYSDTSLLRLFSIYFLSIIPKEFVPDQYKTEKMSETISNLNYPAN